MTSESGLPRPPQMACRLLTLFAPAEQTESIIGDLLEEFLSIASKSGFAFARTWYWRQTLKTIVDLNGSAFGTAPFLMLATLVGGLWLIGFATRCSVHGMQMFLDAHRLYESHPHVYLFWYKFPLQMGRGILCCLIGAFVALIAKRREMTAVIALALAQIALFFAATFTLIFSGREWMHWFLVMLPWISLSSLATVGGGAIVKARRSKVRTPASAA